MAQRFIYKQNEKKYRRKIYFFDEFSSIEIHFIKNPTPPVEARKIDIPVDVLLENFTTKILFSFNLKQSAALWRWHFL